MQENQTLIGVLLFIFFALSLAVVFLFVLLRKFSALERQRQMALNALSISVGNQHLSTTLVSDDVLSFIDRLIEGPTRKWKDARVESLCRFYYTRGTVVENLSCFLDANSPPPQDNQTVLALMLKEGAEIVVMSANVATRSLVVIGKIPDTYPRFGELSKLVASDTSR